jgi:hypothetical protein
VSVASPPPFTSVNPFGRTSFHNPSLTGRRSRLQGRMRSGEGNGHLDNNNQIEYQDSAAPPVSLPNVWNPYQDPWNRGAALGQSVFNPPILQTLPSWSRLSSSIFSWFAIVSMNRITQEFVMKKNISKICLFTHEKQAKGSSFLLMRGTFMR